MQSVARFSLQAPVCDALCDLINNLTKPGRSLCVGCEEVNPAGEGRHRCVRSV